ncbi:hypothetical protein HOY82DRAFT_542559 [Tuber indicum]|nr:hypothetical protein HOY82DRAFT_542559 [Tuber indicum]
MWYVKTITTTGVWGGKRDLVEKDKKGERGGALGVATDQVDMPLVVIVPEPVVAEPVGVIEALIMSRKKAAEDVFEEVVQAVQEYGTVVVEMVLLDKENVREVEVRGKMSRMLREEQEKKAGWKVVTPKNKNKMVD